MILINRLIPDIIPGVILSIDQPNMHGIAAGERTFHVCPTILPKERITDAALSAAHVFKCPPVVNWIDTDRTISLDGNTVGMTLRLSTPVCIGVGLSFSPINMWIQLAVKGGSIGPQEVRDA